MESNLLLCSLCDFRCNGKFILLKHMRDIHENDSNFHVTCELCGRTYKKWNSLKKHLHRDHGSECADVGVRLDADSASTTIQDDWSFGGGSDAQQSVLESQVQTDNALSLDQKWESARFLLKITEEQSLTYAGADSLCYSVQKFVDDVCCRIKENVETVLPHNLSACETEAVLSACDAPVMFDGLMSRYLREKFYREKFHYSVSN